jgi:hypothetical protein
MLRRALALLPLLSSVMLGQHGTVPRASERDYPAHRKLDKLSIGAEYLVHSFSGGADMFIAKDFLVVEVALFPAKGETIIANPVQFTLRINGRRTALEPEPPELVAASLKDPDLRSHPAVQAGVGPVIFGAPQPVERFPGDPTVRPPYPSPGSGQASADQQAPVKAEDLVIDAALPAGEHHAPVSGYLYFAYRGNLKHIRSLDLQFAGSASPVNLPLP